MSTDRSDRRRQVVNHVRRGATIFPTIFAAIFTMADRPPLIHGRRPR